MPRQVRVENPGAMYYVMSRGDQRDDIFLVDIPSVKSVPSEQSVLKAPPAPSMIHVSRISNLLDR